MENLHSEPVNQTLSYQKERTTVNELFFSHNQTMGGISWQLLGQWEQTPQFPYLQMVLP